jgi:parallel beta-helix repeat protein
VVGGTCSGSGLCAIHPSLTTLVTGSTDPTGRYVHNITDDKYYLIATTADASPDTVQIVNNMPDDFTTMSSGKSIEITDGIRPNDTFQIISYAAVTNKSGLACTSPVNGATAAYIDSTAGSQNIVRYADICNLGRATLGKTGLEFDGLNGASGGSVAVEYSRMRRNLRGIFFASTSNMNGLQGIRYNLVQNSSDAGIVIDTGGVNDVSYNRISNNSGAGIDVVNGSNGNTVNSNISYWNTSPGIAIENSKDNHLDSNIVYRTTGSPSGVFLNNSSDVQVTRLISFDNFTSAIQNPGFGVFSLGGKNNLIASSTLFSNSRSGIVVETSPGNAIINNNSFANGYHGMTQVCHLGSDYSVVLFGNNFYSNTFAGLVLEPDGNCTAYLINEKYGTLGNNNFADLNMQAAGTPHAGTHREFLYNTTLGSATTTNLNEMAGALDQSYYIISRKHNGAAGSTQLWGHYVTPADVAETPQNESVDLYNYANNLWEKSATAHTYNGTGTEATNLHYDLSAADLSGGPYYYRLSAQSSTQFEVWRNGVSVGAATAGVPYVDSTGVGFTIDTGAIAYVAGDTYTFATWDASGDANAQKTIAMNLPYANATSSYAVPSAARLELKDSSGINPTQITRGGTVGGYQFSIAGTLDANGYSFNYGGDTGLSSALNLKSGAVILSLDNGAFDNFAKTSGGANAFVSVDSSIIGSGTPSKLLNALSFTNATGIATCNVNVIGNAAAGYWEIASSTGPFSGESFDCANGAADPAPGQIKWTP